MKTRIYKALLFIITVALPSLSCHRQDSYISEGYILGYDQRYCACCGGLWIDFAWGARPATGDTQLIDNTSDIHLGTNFKFPIHAAFNWTVSPNTCGGHKIILQKWIRL